ncbi:MAG: YihY/virulence factor BrkB family protein [Clostridia bacterium]|nr:YihY/virulence factor BrkB family protein [Clostridia bacterium]
MNIDELRGNIDDAYAGLIKKRRGRFWRFSVVLRMILKFTDDMRKDFVGQFAAQSAFYTVLSAVPFIMLVILLLKYIVPFDVNAVISTINTTFPETVSSFLSKMLIEVFYRSKSTAMLSAVVIAALWSSSRGTMAIYCGLNQINGYVRPYNWITARIASFFYNLIFVLVIVASGTVMVFGSTLLKLVEDDFEPAHYLLNWMTDTRIIIVVSLILLVPAFMGMYTILPQRKLKFIRQFPGALATVLGWLTFSFGYRIYIEHYSKYSLIYGSLTAVVLMMLWVFFCLYMLLIGAELNKHIEEGFFRRFWSTLRSKG